MSRGPPCNLPPAKQTEEPTSGRTADRPRREEQATHEEGRTCSSATMDATDDVQGGLTDQQKRDNVIRFAFHGRSDGYEEFCRAIMDTIPPGTTAVLRGSAITGRRWHDHAPFDADGPGTSDL